MADCREETDLISLFNKLSPTTRQEIPGLLEKLNNHSAVLVKDEKGRHILQYHDQNQLKPGVNAANANTIAVSKSEQDAKAKTEVCLEMNIKYFKSTAPPSGVLFNKLKITLKNKQYKENREFEMTKKVLGKGNSAGFIDVIKDKGTGTEHAVKSMTIDVFRLEEIRAWLDLSMDGHINGLVCPELYMFRMEGNKVFMHMEILNNAITLSDVINNHIDTVIKTNAALLKPFALILLHNLLEVVHTVHKKGWAHRDLHSGNMMIQKMSDGEVKIKVLDFGRACTIRTDEENGHMGIRSDYLNALRMFSALWFGQEFTSEDDLVKNWREEVTKYVMQEEERIELFCLFEKGEHNNFGALRQRVEELVKEKGPVEKVTKEVVPVLFPKEFD